LAAQNGPDNFVSERIRYRNTAISLTCNRLKLNAKKTQFIWLGSSCYTASVSHLPLSAGGSTVSPDDIVWSLGMTFDTQLTMRKHVDNVVCSCFFQLHQLLSVRRPLTDEALHALVHAFIALTTAMLFCTVSPMVTPDDCSLSCTLPRG